MEMAGFSRKRIRVKVSLVLLSIFLFLLLFATIASAATLGDINNDGAINVQDVVLALRHVLELETLTTAEKAVADVNGDGNINVQDVTLIMQRALGLIDEFPVSDIEVLSVEAINLKEIEIAFNQPMDPITAQNPDNYVLSGFAAANLNATAAYAEFTDNTNTKVRLVTKGLAVTDRMAPTDLTAKININAVRNASLTEFYSSPALGEPLGTISPDTTSPTVVSVTPLGTNHFMVKYSEAVIGSAAATNNSALKPAAYKIGTVELSNAGLTEVNITNPSNDLRNYLFSLPNTATSIVPIIGSTTIWVNNHAVVNNKVQDYAGNNVPISNNTVIFTEDTTRPTVEKVQIVDRQTVRVTFSEMVRNPANVALIKWGTDTYALATRSANSFSYVSGTSYDVGFSVTNALPVSGSFKLFIPKEQVVDLSGNQMLADYEAQLSGQPSAPMQITAVGTTSGVTIKFSRDIANDATITNKANYRIDDAALPIAATVVRTNSRTVSITTPLAHGNHTVSISGLNDAFAVTIPDRTVAFNVTDIAAPTVVERLGWNNATTANGATRDLLLVTFNKVMKADTLTNAGSYRIEYQGASVQALPVGTVITALAGNKAVLIDMPSQGVLNTSAKLHVGRLVGGTFHGVTDLADNPLAPADWEVQPSAMVTAGLDISVISANGLAADNPVVEAHNKVTMQVNATNLNMFGKAAVSDFTVTRNGTSVTIQAVVPVDTTLDGFFDTLELTFANNTFNASSEVNVGVASTLNTTDRFGVALQAKNRNAVNLIPTQLEGAAIEGTTNPKLIRITTDHPMGAGQAINMKNSLQIRENGVLRPIDNVIQGTDRLFMVTMVNDLDLSAEIIVRTVAQASITAVDEKGLPLMANTTGIRADILAAISAGLGGLDGSALANGSTFAITFNKALAPGSIKAGWDGTAGEAVAVTASAAENTITISGVGTLKVASVTTGGSMSSATMAYNAATRTLTVTFVTISPIETGNIGVTTEKVFTPNANIRDLDLEVINTSFRVIWK